MACVFSKTASVSAASGHLGKRNLWVIPSLDIIVVWNSVHVNDLTESPGNPGTRHNRAVRLMVEAVLDG